MKWRNWKLRFYKQDTMFHPPVKLGIPFIINLYIDPREEKRTADSWVVTPMLKIVPTDKLSARRVAPSDSNSASRVTPNGKLDLSGGTAWSGIGDRPAF